MTSAPGPAIVTTNKSNLKPMASITVKGPLKIIGKVSGNVKGENNIGVNKTKECSIFLKMLTSQNEKVPANFADKPEIVYQKHFYQQKLSLQPQNVKINNLETPACNLRTKGVRQLTNDHQHSDKELISSQTQHSKTVKVVNLDSPACNTRTRRLKKLTYDCKHSQEELKNLTEHNDETLVKVGEEFESRNSLRQYLDKNAVRWHFYYTCAQSNATLIDYRCIYYKPTVSETYQKYRPSGHPVMPRKRKSKTTDCPCMIRVKCFRNTEMVKIDRVCNHHDHPVTEEIFRNLPHAKYLPPDVKEEFLDVIALGINPGLIQKYIESVTGVVINKKIIYNYLDKMRKRSEKRKFTIKKINDLKEKIQKIQDLYGNYKPRKNVQTEDRKENVPNIQNDINLFNCTEETTSLSTKKSRLEVIEIQANSSVADDTSQVCSNDNLILDHNNLTYVIINNAQQHSKTTTKKHLQFEESFLDLEESPVYEQCEINNGKEEIPAVAETVMINDGINQVNGEAVLDRNDTRGVLGYCGEHTVPPYYLYVLKEDRFFKPGDRLWGPEDLDDNLSNLKTQFMIDYICVEHREEPSEYFRYQCNYSAPLKNTLKGKRKRTKMKNTCPSEIRLTRFSSDECDDLQLTVTYVCNHHDHPLTEKQLYQLELSKKLPTHIKDEIRDLIFLDINGSVVRKYVELETGLVMNQCLEKTICNIERNCKKRNFKPKYSTEKLRLLWEKIQHAEEVLDADSEVPDLEDGTQCSSGNRASIYDNDTDHKSLKRGIEQDETENENKKSRLETCLQNLVSDEETLRSVQKLQESVRCETQRNPWVQEEYIPYRDLKIKLNKIKLDFGGTYNTVDSIINEEIVENVAECIDVYETNTSSSVINDNLLKNDNREEIILEVNALDNLNFENGINEHLEMDTVECGQDETQQNNVIIETSYDDNASYIDENYFNQNGNGKLSDTCKDKRDFKNNTNNVVNLISERHKGYHPSDIEDNNVQSSSDIENTAKTELKESINNKIYSENSEGKKNKKNKVDDNVVVRNKNPQEMIKVEKSPPVTMDSNESIYQKNTVENNAAILLHNKINLKKSESKVESNAAAQVNDRKYYEKSESKTKQKNKVGDHVVHGKDSQEINKAIEKSSPVTKDTYQSSNQEKRVENNAVATVNDKNDCKESESYIKNNVVALVNNKIYSEKLESKSNKKNVDGHVVYHENFQEKIKAAEKSLPVTVDSKTSIKQENEDKINKTALKHFKETIKSVNTINSKTHCIESTKCDTNLEIKELECNIESSFQINENESPVNSSINESNDSDLLKNNANVKDVIYSDVETDHSDDVVFLGYIVPGKAPKTEANEETPTLLNENILDRILKPNNPSNCEIEVNVQVERLEKNAKADIIKAPNIYDKEKPHNECDLKISDEAIVMQDSEQDFINIEIYIHKYNIDTYMIHSFFSDCLDKLSNKISISVTEILRNLYLKRAVIVIQTREQCYICVSFVNENIPNFDAHNSYILKDANLRSSLFCNLALESNQELYRIKEFQNFN